MGGSYSISNFPCEEELEIYKVYLTNNDKYKKNIKNISIQINNGLNIKNVSSIIYTIQFIEENTVLEEITITIKYQKKNNNVQVQFRKHIMSNLETTDVLNDIYCNKRIGFPHNPIIIKNDSVIKIEYIHKNRFIISIMDNNNQDTNRLLGILEIKNNNKSIISIENVIKCVVKTSKYNYGKSKMNFILHSIRIDDNEQFFLTKNNKRYIFTNKSDSYIEDSKIEDINFIFNKANILSWHPKPKTKISIERVKRKKYIIYNFTDNKYIV